MSLFLDYFILFIDADLFRSVNYFKIQRHFFLRLFTFANAKDREQTAGFGYTMKIFCPGAEKRKQETMASLGFQKKEIKLIFKQRRSRGESL